MKNKGRTIEPDFSQMGREEQAELYRQETEFVSTVKLIEGHTAGLRAAKVVGKFGPNTAKIREHLQQLAALSNDALGMIPKAVMVLALMACLAGCSGDVDPIGRAASTMNSQGVGGCTDERCLAR